MDEERTMFAAKLKTNLRYADAYLRGSNSTLVRLLREVTPDQTVPARRTRDETITAVSPYLKLLSSAQQGALELIIGTAARPGVLDFASASRVQAVKELWIDTAVSGDASTALDALSTRPATYADVLGISAVSLAVVREAMRGDSESYYNRYQRGEI